MQVLMHDESEWLKLLPIRARAVYSAMCLAAYLRSKNIECSYSKSLISVLLQGCSIQDIDAWNDDVCRVHLQCVAANPKHKIVYDCAVDACLEGMFCAFIVEDLNSPLIQLYKIVRELQCGPNLSELMVPPRNAADEWGEPCDLSCYLKAPGESIGGQT